MADKPNKPVPGGNPAPNAKPTNPRAAEIQRRAQTMANRKPVSPQTFFQESWVELKKTTWPSRPVLVKSTTVVLALVLAVAIWVGALDAIFTRVLTPLFSAAH